MADTVATGRRQEMLPHGCGRDMDSKKVVKDSASASKAFRIIGGWALEDGTNIQHKKHESAGPVVKLKLSAPGLARRALALAVQ